MSDVDQQLAATFAQIGKPAEAPPVRRIPPWLTVTVVTAAVIAGGWLAWGFWEQAGAGRMVVVLPRDPFGSVQRNGKGWLIASGPGSVSVTPKAADVRSAEVLFSFRTTTPEQRAVLSEASQLVAEREMNGLLLGLSDEQFKVLAEIVERRWEPLRLSPGTQERFRSLIAEYEPLATAAEKAPAGERDARERARQAVAQTLCEAVEEQARDRLPAVRKSIAQRTIDAKAALTAEQWRKYRGDRPVVAATAPSRRRR